MKTTSVRTYATENVEGAAVTQITAFDIVAAMEERFMDRRPMVTHLEPLSLDTPLAARATKRLIRTIADEMKVSANDEALTIRAKRLHRKMLRGNFGPKPEWLPKDELRIIEQAKEGLEGWEDKLAATMYAVEKVKSRQAWKRQMMEAQAPERYQSDEDACYELPPLVKGKSHEPAFYAIVGPSGRKIDLSQPEGPHRPILSKNPPEAFRRFIARLEVNKAGGDTELLNYLLKAEKVELVDEKGNVSKEYKFLPSYVSRKIDGVWHVDVGWRLNPKIAASRYWLDADGELTEQDPNAGLEPGMDGYEPPLTLSQLDYHLLCDTKDLAVQDEDGNVVDYMNEEEEFLGMFGDREESETFIDLDQFVAGEGEGDYDDDELSLIKECSFNVDRSESGITMGDLQSQAFIRHLDEKIREAEAELAEVDCFGEDTPEAAAAAKRLARANKLDDSWNRFVGTQNDDALIRYWYPTGTNRMLTMGLDVDFLKEMPQDIAGASTMPENAIASPVVHKADYVRGRTVSLTLEDAKQMRRQKHVCRAINNGYFPHLIREKAAQNEFANVLDSLLSASR